LLTGDPISIRDEQTETSMATETSLEEARLLLTNCLDNSIQHENTKSIDYITSRLEPITIDRDNGELVRNVKKLYGSSPSVALFRFFGFCVYLSSNNLMSDHETDKFLRWMTQNGHSWILRTLFRWKTSTVEVFATNLLVSAARLEDVDTVQILIEGGVEINAPSGRVHRSTALQETVRKGNVRLVEILLNAGADPNIQFLGMYGGTVLHDALRSSKNVDLTRMLLEAGADPNPPDIADKEPPLLCAVKESSAEMVDLLLTAKADPNRITENEWHITALQVATSRCDAEMVQLLVDAGADVDAPSSKDYEEVLDSLQGSGWNEIFITPIQIAAENKDAESVQILLAAGAGVDLFPANRYEKDVRSIIQGDEEFSDGIPVVSALQAAVKNKDVVMTRVLLGAGANIDARAMNGYGNTALQIAATVDNERLVRLLLQKGANLNAPAGRYRGKTALQAAAAGGNVDLLQKLVDAGADIILPQYI
jgi:ankyrin repeat protein